MEVVAGSATKRWTEGAHSNQEIKGKENNCCTCLQDHENEFLIVLNKLECYDVTDQLGTRTGTTGSCKLSFTEVYIHIFLDS